MMTGKCLCGEIRYEIEAALGPMTYCHCSMCRRASGTAFATNASVRTRALRFISGEGVICEYESSPGKFRAFCPRCGSPIYSRRADDPGTLRLRLGTLDGDPGQRPVIHVSVGSKAPWFELTDGLPWLLEDAPAPPVEWDESGEEGERTT
ncbi:MAG: GFA family protein [Deltaproteobacteria bacterium]|nr:GFA family protein [Deltaproteobacteria bacterium]